MSETEDFLSHHGVLGMKWGIRHDKGHVGQKARIKKINKLDSEFVKKAPHSIMAIYDKAAERMNNGEIQKFNANPKWRGVNVGKDDALSKSYRDAYSKAFTKLLNEVSTSNGNGLNASGTKKILLDYDANTDGLPRWKIVSTNIKHSDTVEPVKVVTKYDSLGHIVHMTFVPMDNTLSQGVDIRFQGEDFLAHHGVLGMHWGRHLPGRGGRLSSNDHTESRSLNKKKVHELSNPELRKVNERLQLESKHAQLNPGAVVRGQKFAATFLAVAGTGTALYALSKNPATKKGISFAKEMLSKALSGTGRHLPGKVIALGAKAAGRHL